MMRLRDIIWSAPHRCLLFCNRKSPYTYVVGFVYQSFKQNQINETDATNYYSIAAPKDLLALLIAYCRTHAHQTRSKYRALYGIAIRIAMPYRARYYDTETRIATL